MSEQRSSAKAIVWQGKNHRAIVSTENAPQEIVNEQLLVPRDHLAIKRAIVRQAIIPKSNGPLKKQLYDKENTLPSNCPDRKCPTRNSQRATVATFL